MNELLRTPEMLFGIRSTPLMLDPPVERWWK